MPNATFKFVWDNLLQGESFLVADDAHRDSALACAIRHGHTAIATRIPRAGYKITLVAKAQGAPKIST